MGAASEQAARTGEKQLDLGGRLVTPGLIDCHTHLVYAGERAGEWAMRLGGATYEEIARKGGGIASTVQATRTAGKRELLDTARGRLRTLMHEGLTTVEIKSGYGLDTATELRMLQVARELGATPELDVIATFLGAHAVPPEYRGEREAYLRLLVEEMLPAVAAQGLADAVDAYCENLAFTANEVRTLFRARPVAGPACAAARRAVLRFRWRGNGRGTWRAVLRPSRIPFPEGIEAMAAAGTVAVLAPGAYYYLHETRKPPVEALRAGGVPMAVSTDHNPGTSPMLSLLTAMNMACVLFGLTPEEALLGVTANAARALGLEDRGAIEPGKLADLAVWDVQSPDELSYALGRNPCYQVYKNGTLREA